MDDHELTLQERISRVNHRVRTKSSKSRREIGKKPNYQLKNIDLQAQDNLVKSQTIVKNRGLSAKDESRFPTTISAQRDRHRPKELSATQVKKQPPTYRHQLPGKPAGRDPRFVAVSGADEATARQRYAFLYEEILPKERAQYKKSLQSTKQPEARKQLRSRLASIEQTMHAYKVQEAQAELQAAVSRKERDEVSQGKKPFYIGPKHKHELKLLAKYQELKKTGKLSVYLEKKRKKNASKDKGNVPHGRRQSQLN